MLKPIASKTVSSRQKRAAGLCNVPDGTSKLISTLLEMKHYVSMYDECWDIAFEKHPTRGDFLENGGSSMIVVIERWPPTWS